MSVDLQSLGEPTILTTNDPTTLLSELESNQLASFLILRRPIDLRPSGYLIERVHERSELCKTRQAFGLVCYEESEEDEEYDAIVPVSHLWELPLQLSFPDLVVLDLGMEDAVLWMIPILNAISPSSPFRRLLLRNCDSWTLQARPFPFMALDNSLRARPEVKVLLGWAMDKDDGTAYVSYFRSRLQRLESDGRLAILYRDGSFFIQFP